MMYKVYHAQSRGIRFEHEPENWSENRDDYKLVAEVEASSMDEVFEKTNHIDRPWPDNPGVKAHGESHRSTSVGDVIEGPDGQAHMVAPAGFTELEDEEEEEDYTICSSCNGSGEGMYDGSRCSSCKGSGEVYCGDPDYSPEEEAAYYADMARDHFKDEGF